MNKKRGWLKELQLQVKVERRDLYTLGTGSLYTVHRGGKKNLLALTESRLYSSVFFHPVAALNLYALSAFFNSCTKL
jgi:hypothetical protein